MPGNGAPRDPVSISFDASARRLLDRVYATRGQWAQVWLPDPTPAQLARWSEIGIYVDGPDPLPPGGGVNAHTRWARAFIRSAYFQHKNFSPVRKASGWKKRTSPRSSGGLRVQVGRHVPGTERGLPPRRRVRVMLAAGGQAKARAVARLGDRDRIYTDTGRPAARWADPRGRDW